MQYSAKGILRFFFFIFPQGLRLLKQKLPSFYFSVPINKTQQKNMSIRLCVLAVIECSWAGNIAFAIMVFVY